MIFVNKEAIKQRMIKRGFTGAGLALKANVSKSYVCQILNGRRTVLAPTAKKICDALDCEFDEVFEIREQKQKLSDKK